MKFVGGDLLRFDVEKQTVEILKPGLLIDLGAIGKGYAADQALRVLRDLGLGSAVINASGDVLFGEAPPGKQGWPAAIASFPSGEEPTFLEPLANLALFRRDAYLCLYCGGRFSVSQLSRDHVNPLSLGGCDGWQNVVSACRRCNHHKGGRTPEDAGMELLAVPFVPTHAEYIYLSGRIILSDQMAFLLGHFPRNSPLHLRIEQLSETTEGALVHGP